MFEHDLFFDISSAHLNHAGEELCGDEVKILRTADKSIIVLSDGLGSGVKANILARLTSSIIVSMLSYGAPLKDVIETVLGTLPVCKVRQIAYSTFLIIEIDHATGAFKVINCDSPDVFLLRQDVCIPMEQRKERILGKELRFCEGRLDAGDFLAAASDGVIHAGVGSRMNPLWGRDDIGKHLQQARPRRSASAERIVVGVMRKTAAYCQGTPGDDATFIGILARHPRRLMIFTGPPLDKTQDEALVQRFTAFTGRKVVCGGTTANIVAEHFGEVIRSETGAVRGDLPPVAEIAGIDLVTEGMLTMARTLQLLQQSEGKSKRLPIARDGAVLLARELLSADAIHLLVGQQVNPYYQNPLLPRHISIRRNLVEQISALLQTYQRDVKIEWV